MIFARQTIPVYYPRTRFDPGPQGCIGIGVPFAIGAKAAKPDKAVVVLSGDSSFGFNGMEMDTAIRYKLPIMVVMSNNGRIGGALPGSPSTTGRVLGFTRYDEVVEALGGYGEFVERPEDIRGALERAFSCGKPALVNVVTDPTAMAHTRAWTADMIRPL